MLSALRDDRDRRRRFRYGIPAGPLIATVVALGLAGCSARVHAPYVPDDLPALFRPIAAASTAFDYRDSGSSTSTLDGVEVDVGDYWVQSLTTNATRASDQFGDAVAARYFEGKVAGAKPLVIVLPVWGVSTYPSDTIAAGLREQSAGAINILQVDGDRMLFDWDALASARSEAEFHAQLALMIEHFIDVVIDIRRLVDWAETRPEVDARRIALIGFSMSAIVGSVAMANEPRIGVGVLVLGGADLQEVLAVCNGRIRSTRENVLKRFGWSIEEFKEQLKEPLEPVNPARYAGRVDPAGVLVIDAAKDTCVPESARERFWVAMGRPERVSYQYDHRATFLAMTFLGGNNLQDEIYRFLDRTLAPRSVRYEAAQNDQGWR
jgi:dienelactone hydrolase